MATTVPTRTTSADRTARLLTLAGALLLAAGIAMALAHLAAVGMALRWTGIALLLVAAIRKPSLMSWTFLAMLAGVEIGLDAPHAAVQMRLPGDLFLRLIRMIVAPLLFATITTGIAGHHELRS